MYKPICEVVHEFAELTFAISMQTTGNSEKFNEAFSETYLRTVQYSVMKLCAFRGMYNCNVS